MPVIKEAYSKLVAELKPGKVTLVAVSKSRTIEEIKELYELGNRDFGENYVQELKEKQVQLPDDIRWHFIGHLQTNKVKQIASFIHLVQSIDSLKLLKEINRQAQLNFRVINCLLQVHIAQEETKFGLDEKELHELFVTNSHPLHELKNVCITGLMGIASLTNDPGKIRNEFKQLKRLYEKYGKLQIANCQLTILSIGMSSDYRIAVEEGSNMVRIGSLIFGDREKLT